MIGLLWQLSSIDYGQSTFTIVVSESVGCFENRNYPLDAGIYTLTFEGKTISYYLSLFNILRGLCREKSFASPENSATKNPHGRLCAGS